jgi:hypothetical protein
MTTRILFLARYRIPHACFSLQWDHNLVDVDRTIIASPVPQEEIWQAFEAHGIDCNQFEYINDSVIFAQYPEVENWVFADDYRGWWLRQQAIKLAYLDLINADVMLMHDPDTFQIEPYSAVQDNNLNLLAIKDTEQGSYRGVFEAITGIPHPSPHCYVTELCAVRGTDFQALKSHLQSRWPQKKWLDAIIEAVPGMPTVPPWGTGNIIKWFSEYELLGNWAVTRGSVQHQWQVRHEYDSLNNIADFTAAHSAVCDAVPDLSSSMRLTEQGTVEDYARYTEKVKERQNELRII